MSRTVRPANGDDVPGQQRVTWELVPLPLAVHLHAAKRASGSLCFVDLPMSTKNPTCGAPVVILVMHMEQDRHEKVAFATWIGCFGVVNERSSLRLRSRCVTTVHSNITSIPSVNSE